MPPEKVLSRSVSLLKKLAIVMRHQSERFDSESVESFSVDKQEAFARVAHLLSNAAVECDHAMEHIAEAHKLLQ
jgi:hypothetical protein